jgi:hypothetical protein
MDKNKQREKVFPNCPVQQAYKLWDEVRERHPIALFEKGKCIYNNARSQIEKNVERIITLSQLLPFIP